MLNFQKILIIVTLILCTIISCTMPAAEVAGNELTETALEKGMKPTTDSASKEVLPDFVKSGYYRGSKIYYEVIDGKNIFDGDIIIPDHQLSSEPGRAAVSYADSWPNKTVYYEISPTLSTERKAKVEAAIDYCNRNIGLDFIPRTNEVNYIYFDYSHSFSFGGASSVGMIGGRQEIYIQWNTKYLPIGFVLHHIGHSLGLHHEHTRQDRDEHININWSNIKHGHEYFFVKYDDLEGGVGGYDFNHFDFDSLMLQSSTIDNGEHIMTNQIPTLTNKDGTPYSVQRETFSIGDILAIQSKYHDNFRITAPLDSILQKSMSYENGAKLIAGDFDGDGLTDLIRQERGLWSSEDSLNTFGVYYSNGDGSFESYFPTGHIYEYDMKADNGANIIPGDFDGDGTTDFIRQEFGGWAASAGNTFSVYFSQGRGRDFRKVIYSSGGYADYYQFQLRGDLGCNIIPGDFNGDGKTDFIRQEKHGWDNDEDNTFSIYISEGDGHFTKTVPAYTTFQQSIKGDDCNLIPGDFNGDNITDFIRQEKGLLDDDTFENFTVYLSVGDGTFSKQINSDTNFQYALKSDSGCNIIPGDFDNDGKTDFIRQEHSGWAASPGNTLNIYYSLGDGNFRIVKPKGAAYQELLRGDLGTNIIVGNFYTSSMGRDSFIRQERGGWNSDDLYTLLFYKAVLPPPVN